MWAFPSVQFASLIEYYLITLFTSTLICRDGCVNLFPPPLPSLCELLLLCMSDSSCQQLYNIHNSLLPWWGQSRVRVRKGDKAKDLQSQHTLDLVVGRR